MHINISKVENDSGYFARDFLKLLSSVRSNLIASRPKHIYLIITYMLVLSVFNCCHPSLLTFAVFNCNVLVTNDGLKYCL